MLTAEDYRLAYEQLRLALVPGFMYSASVTLNQAELLQINTTPKVIVPAPGANLIVAPAYYSCVYSGGNPAFATDFALNLRYAGFPATAICTPNAPAAINNNRRSNPQAKINTAAFAGAVANMALVVIGAGNWTGAGVVNSCQLNVCYVLLSVPGI